MQSIEDNEVECVGSNVQKIDPITKQPFVDRIKNKICGHIYGSASIGAMLKRTGYTSCPYAGCNCRKFSLSDLDTENIVKVENDEDLDASVDMDEYEKDPEIEALKKEAQEHLEFLEPFFME